MIEQKKKLRLDELQVDSFVTTTLFRRKIQLDCDIYGVSNEPQI